MDLPAAFMKFMAKSRFSILSLAFFIALPLFALLRVVLLIKQWDEIDSSIFAIIGAFLLGILSDISFLSYYLIPFILYLLLIPQGLYQHRGHRYFINSLLFINIYALFFILTSEWFFWDEFGVRFNFIAVDYLVYTTEVIQNIVESYPLPKILTVLFVISVLCFWFVKQYAVVSFTVQETWQRKGKIAAVLFAVPVLSFLSIGQSFHQFTANKYLNELAANGPYQFFAAFKNSELDYHHFYKLADDKQLSATIKQLLSQQGNPITHPQLYNIQRTIKATAPEKQLNVILITVESLSAEYLKTFGNTENISPFMDEWFKEGLLFTQFYATGTRTIRGLEALTLSYPPTAGRSIVKRPDNGHLFNLGYVFKQKGYDTAFLYGGNGYFDNMNAFYAENGFRIIDKLDLTQEEITFSNAWGVSDDVIFKRTMKEADSDYQKKQPFFFQIMTTTNHRPYTYPDGKIDIPSGKGARNGGVKFTDYAIHEFIEMAKKKPWFADTVFVMVADHCGGSARKVELPVDRYHIPLFIYSPKHIKPQIISTLSSQIDVAPTLLGLLNFSYESWFFGQDILQTKPEQGRALIGNYQKLGLFKDNKLAFLSVQQKVDVILDPLGKHLAVPPETQAQLVTETMAYYQSADYIWTHRLTRYK